MLKQLLDRARSDGRNSLFEHEVYELLRSYDLPVPAFKFLQTGEAVPADLNLPGDRLVLKVVQDDITHKSDQGGVMVSARATWKADLETMKTRFPQARGILAVEFVPHNADALGSEIMLGLKYSDIFGYVLSFGPGGTDAEHLHTALPNAHRLAALEMMTDEASWSAFFQESAVTPYLTGQVRGKKKQVDLKACTRWALGLRKLSADAVSAGIVIEVCELNPLAPKDGQLIALDAVFRFTEKEDQPSRAGIQDFARRKEKIEHLLHPRTVAIIGVSATNMNPGRTIVNNLVHEGFDASKIYIIKPGAQEVDGCRCVPSISALPEKVDVFVLSVDASQVPAVLHEVNEHDRAHSVILISGGMAEKAGGEALEQQVIDELKNEKFILNGGNCLGIRSLSAHFHTFFIDSHKLPMPTGGKSNVAIISQSGAFAIVRMHRFSWMDPRYNISTGNQTDQRAVDYLEALADDPAIDVFGLYLEGLKPGDGLRLVRAIAKVKQLGKHVVIYKAGRTASGRSAVQGHTASIAGDYPTTLQVLERAGATMAQTFEEFEDQLMLSCYFSHFHLNPRQLFAVSNAGFECAAIGDHLRGIELLDLQTNSYFKAELEAVLTKHRLAGIVGARNPLDVTPMAGDAPLIDLYRLSQASTEIGAFLFSIVPFAPTIQSLPASEGQNEDLLFPDALIAAMAASLMTRPTLICIDAGAQYDPYCQAFFKAGFPVLRSIDRCAEALSRFFQD
ncbi:hypothetical protein AUK40_03755 [Candidatus Wirthbacteria bacterium CG2_30_54_11]|uniref:CoA-binding domain-containing protein n=1 Tax=Candidatus Wirthbacteria bacterium CG2_30_54_11 TaxID=1817892 RepID=A0A1J5IKB1_9BACT|nr:MAG: hypothetical protein AUK40_03755 [Candidatus Wirthbacteria bacterium CG2_30_54_11]